MVETPQQQLQRLLTSIPALRREEAVSLLVTVSSLHAALHVHLLTLGPAVPENPNQLLTAKEAARRLGISPRQLYRKANELPFTRRELGGLLFHAGGLSQWIALQERDE